MMQLAIPGTSSTFLDPDRAPDRGAWVTPKWIADAVGAFDLDPFTNPRSHIRAWWTCMLERGDNGFGDGTPGSFLGRRVLGYDPNDPLPTNVFTFDDEPSQETATADTRVWIQPDYGFVLEAIRHYGHTRFTALLRLDTSTLWFEELYALSALILVPKRERIEFEPPPGVPSSSNPFPHGLFFKRAKDATKAIRAACYEWKVRR